MKLKTVLIVLIALITFFVGASSANAKARIYQQETKIYLCYGETTATIYTKGAVRVNVSRSGDVYAGRYQGRDKFGVQKWKARVQYSGKLFKKITIKVTALSKKGKNASAKITTFVRLDPACS